MLLKDKVCIVTGAAGEKGIGLRTAKLFYEHGASIVISDINQQACDQVRSEFDPERSLVVVGNVANRDDCFNLAKAVTDKFGRIDVLINNAGITQPVKFEEILPEDYDRILDVNLRGMLYMSQAVVPYMKAAKSGSIINTSSVSAQRGGGIFGGPHYSAAKAGMLGLGKAMARELGAFGIRINSVTPGLIATDITAGKLDDQMKAKILEGIALARMGTPEDVAKAFLFLASDLSSYITGATLDVNGGMHIH
ncbi:SDR family NAD(P)-dependent oxidoreductase [Vreelandella aquamarina]|jgi:NAD(P)-dependent dehydrogenase (short-subunit alcohol dehydrogenase family)|uniref:NAD(P)-dependent dehydrogenase, short-chain alcohol dehydrogenase family n=2 Tax=Gammaproteobacteria TaxID=1236 RepID=A0A1N6D9M7_9GAMM|nr:MULTISPECIES: glucose 1-dehydrogenase [Halomonas]HAO01679.1 3-oxoacyl-ACP reductase [Halomonas sp.]SIN61728.1 NAD(P)-dependent dehydrogenase, short-chain alcohol dehydrogenase family [Halomonas meridiana]SIN67393.1 NAD(P)-dependent dehydrogenase, short-chain alcohol dehydrogenase family [Halomonas meridiana]SIN94651.1 NAD(P)-dependent dehydrogenase, short-chain alcohol dehydrogenase family [Halomonas meridiana]GED45951.1 short-chain dehydrogenase [Halomonas meridiana]|tara:strand:+ start:1851 stop:2603 length:753 start_codon:yes stop_codon:yes gene_type:complete